MKKRRRHSEDKRPRNDDFVFADSQLPHIDDDDLVAAPVVGISSVTIFLIAVDSRVVWSNCGRRILVVVISISEI
jgi:hypothetical protein